jgi:hypothetical protein
MASGSLDTGQAGKKVWLVKVPTVVAKQWRAAAAASVAGGEAPELGRIRFSHDATQVCRCKVRLFRHLECRCAHRALSLLIALSGQLQLLVIILFACVGQQVVFSREALLLQDTALPYVEETLLNQRVSVTGGDQEMIEHDRVDRQAGVKDSVSLIVIGAASQNASQFELQLADGQSGTAPREFNVRVQTEDMQGMHCFAESRERGVSERLSCLCMMSRLGSARIERAPGFLLNRVKQSVRQVLCQARPANITQAIPLRSAEEVSIMASA